MPKSSKRLSILNKDEIKDLFNLPRFNNEERESFFSLDPNETLIFENLRNTNSKLLYLMQLAYFKVSHQFYVFAWEDIQNDYDYLVKRYFNGISETITLPTKNTRLSQQKIILKSQGFRLFGIEEHEYLSIKTDQICKTHAKPRFIFTELFRILDDERITVPGYSTFQKIISKSIIQEQKRICKYINSNVSGTHKNKLDKLLTIEGSFYQLTALKKRAKDFGLKQIRKEIEKHSATQKLYEFSKIFLPQLNVSHENIKYYSSLAEYYPVHRLQNMNRDQAHLYLICFVYHCFEQMSDNLIISFIYQVTMANQESKKIGEKQFTEYHLENRKQLDKTGKLVNFFIDESIDDSLPFGSIKTQAFKIIKKNKIQQVVNYLSGEKRKLNYYVWEHIHTTSRKTALNIRPLFMAIDFKSTIADDLMIEIIDKLKQFYESGRSNYPEELLIQLKSIIPKKLTSIICKPSHYEMYVYQQLRKGLDAGDIYYSKSTRYKSFDEDLVSQKDLEDKKELIESLGFKNLNTPIEKRLEDLKVILEQRYKEVNENILKGKNNHLKYSNKNQEVTWRLPYKKQEDTINNPFYEQLPQVGIINILKYVNQECDFLEAFKHIQPKYTKNKPDWGNIMACIISYGERIGLTTMPDISDTKIHLLRTTAKNHIRLENTRKANDLIVNKIASLPIFKYYNFDVGTLHASADGQKFEASRSTFKARHSKKYFGLNKGLVNYSMVVNHVPVNAKLIGANEHESHYAFDIIFNNTSEINPDVISVDMAGTNQVNFVLLEIFGRKWAPRYTQINQKATKLVGFNSVNGYPDEYLIKPSKQAETDLILSESENIQRIFKSMALKTTTQSNIVRKLSSYARKNRTKKAL